MQHIELHEATITPNIATVAYTITDGSTVTDITSQQIRTDTLVEYIESNELNLETFFNYKLRNLECDGMDERYVDAFGYLTNNLNNVVEQYLTDNLK